LGYIPLSQIATLTSGTTPEHTDEKKDETDIYFIKSADIKRFSINYQTTSFISQNRHQVQSRSAIKKNDVLISNTGKYLGFTSLFTDDQSEANINQNSIRVRFHQPNNSVYNPLFLSLFLNSKFGQEEIQSYLTITGQKYLNMQNFRTFKLPKYEQVYIDSFTDSLTKIYQFDTKANELIEEAKTFFNKVLGLSEINIENPKNFVVNLSDFEKEDIWTPRFSNPKYVNTEIILKERFKHISLGQIADFQKGDEPGSNSYIEYRDSKETDIPFIRTTDIVNHECDMFPDFYIPYEYSNELKQDIQKGDILFTKDGKIGETAILTKNDQVFLSSGILRIRISDYNQQSFGLTPEYVFTCLSTKETGYFPAIRRTIVGTTIPHLREERIKQINIPLIDLKHIKFITETISNALDLKSQRKVLVKEVIRRIDKDYESLLNKV
jgi:type I restriction enzyme S subunit